MICNETQGYYDNATSFYSSLGMKSHGGEDWNCGYGSPIQCPLDGYIYSIFNAIHKAADGYYALYIIATYKGQLGELCIGHLDPVASVGTQITKGQILGTESNHGVVYEGKTLITLAMQAKGDHRGHHRHWQWRPIKRIKTPLGQCLVDFTGYLYMDTEGYFYQVINPENGNQGLSPDIHNILEDYDEFRMKNGIIEATVEEKSLFVKILTSFKDILIAVFNKRNE